MTPARAPDTVRDVPGLLTYAMPVTFTAEGLDGERIECTGVVLDAPEPNTTWRVANFMDGVSADLYGDETRDMCPDWSSPHAIYACLHWLADRGHVCLWMLPTTHGGRVEAWDGLTAWEVSAILVARSVVRVARGLGAVCAVYGPFAPCPDREACMGTRDDIRGPGFSRMHVWRRGSPGWMVGTFSRGPETGEAGKLAADRAALADGCAILAPSGILLPD